MRMEDNENNGTAKSNGRIIKQKVNTVFARKVHLLNFAVEITVEARNRTACIFCNIFLYKNSMDFLSSLGYLSCN